MTLHIMAIKRLDIRCQWCGRSQINAERNGSTKCNPPFDVKPHLFSGYHPADIKD